MKTSQQWVESQITPIRAGESRWSLSLKDIEEIQRDAFDAGVVEGVKRCAVKDPMLKSWLNFMSDTQPKDTPCSKNTP